MLLKLELRSLTDRQIPVPWATGFQELDSQVENYLYRISLPEDRPLAEFVFTPFKNALWSDLWYVKLVNREKKGIVAKLAQFMQDRKINIIGMDSNTILQGKYHVSKIAIDCRRYKSEEDGNYNYRRNHPGATMNLLKKELTLKFIEEIRFFEPSYPCISIERNQSLWRLEKEINEHAVLLSEESLCIRDGCFEMPPKYIDQIRRSYTRNTSGGKNEPQVLMTFDEESDFLRLVIFFKNFGIAPFTVSVKNRPGAIAAVAKSLSEEGYNILASKGHSIDIERIFIWMLLQTPSCDLTPIADQMLVERVREILLSSEAVRVFRPQIVSQPIFQEM